MSKNADWLEKVLKENGPIPKLVTVVNPGNPSGAFIPRPMLEVISLHKHLCFSNNYRVFPNIALSFQRISDLCKNAGAWLVVDNTYE
jgi:aromatic aminotransferase